MSKNIQVHITLYDDGNPHNLMQADSAYRALFTELCSPRFDTTLPPSSEEPPFPLSEETPRLIREQWLGESAVTVVLIGNETWRRRAVDWEIAASLWPAPSASGSGLVGILLPSYRGKRYPLIHNEAYLPLENNPKAYVSRRALPQRLAANVANGFAKLYEWNDDPLEIRRWIDAALQRRESATPDNSMRLLRRNC